MQIRLGCQCGQQLITDDSFAGQTVRCPHCQLLLRVPHLPPTQPAAGQPPPPAAPPYQPAPQPAQAYQPAPTFQPPPAYQPPPAAPGFAPAGYHSPLPQSQLQASTPPPPGMPMLPPGRPLPLPGTPSAAGDRPIMVDEAADEAEEERQRRRKERARTRRHQLKVAAMGLTLIFWSIVCVLGILACVALIFVIAMIAGIVNAFNAGSAAAPDPGPIIPILMFVAFLLVFLHGILYVVGSVLCCWVPPKSGARPYILVSVGLVGAAFAMSVLQFVLGIMAAASGNPMTAAFSGGLSAVLGILSILFGVAGFVLFFLFLRAVAEFLQERSTGEEVIAILTRWIVLVVISIVIALIDFFLLLFLLFVAPLLTLLICAVTLVTCFCFLVQQWIRLLNVVGTIRQSIAREFGI